MKLKKTVEQKISVENEKANEVMDAKTKKKGLWHEGIQWSKFLNIH